MKLFESLNIASRQLAPMSDTPHLDAELLLMQVLGFNRSHLRLYENQILTDRQQLLYEEMLARRLRGEPIAYIIGKKEFWSLDFEVTPDTLIPRPDTELLIECILKLPLSVSAKAADLGTGSGAIALTLAKERPNWQLTATDISENALTIARKNAQQLGIANISFYCGDWCTVLPHNDYEIIVSNPPYIGETEWEAFATGLMYEPRRALLSGKEGLDAILQIAQGANEYLSPLGYLFLEHGYRQAEKVQKVLVANGYINIHSVNDLSGNQRVSYGQKAD